MEFDVHEFDALGPEDKKERWKTLTKDQKLEWSKLFRSRLVASVRYQPELWNDNKSENDLRMEKDSQIFEIIEQGAKRRVVGFHHLSAMNLGYFEASRWVPYKDKTIALKMIKSLEDAKTCETGGEANPYVRFHLLDKSVVSIARIR